MLPISAKDRIDIRPYDYALELARRAAERTVAEAKAAVEAAGSDKSAAAQAAKDLAAAEKRAETMVSDAQAELDRHPDQAAYQIKVPTTRSRAAATRDIGSEGIATTSNYDIVVAALTAELPDQDRQTIEAVKTLMDEGTPVPPADWDQVWNLARGIPASAKLIADRAYRWEMERFHLIRHHVLIEGQRSPLPEAVVDSIPENDRALLAAKIIEMLTVPEHLVKN